MSVLPIVATETIKRTPPLPACVFTCNPTTVLDQLPTDIWELEQLTISQSESSLWKYQRKWRLTASNFYKVCVRRKDHTKLASTLLSSHSSDLSLIPAIAYGNKYESLARTQIRSLYPDSLVRKVGLVTHPAMPHLAMSSDGLIHNFQHHAFGDKINV
ncbi:hypothetical protein JTE90_029235 [Oedothorax gibbosus]|uniref:Uncharacterized protein n=1 Tax=Oedothorax gibbosus TaxID=931172 RepID=A0AAV6TUX9_9ARAC|nr:hypothetical protein JTE90_029235 [Oedothorax gibbosus]